MQLALFLMLITIASNYLILIFFIGFTTKQKLLTMESSGDCSPIQKKRGFSKGVPILPNTVHSIRFSHLSKLTSGLN